MISVIVPVYNVEKYLRVCLDSLVAQTQKDIEIILVDDGSTDHSGKMVDEYVDKGFRVFHTENGGLSAARNYGLSQSKGEWVMFVDSDDWVAPEFCEIPFREAIKSGADIVAFEACVVRDNKRVSKTIAEKTRGVVDKETAIDFGGIVAWNKLYRRSLFAGIQYPEGRTYEDLATTHKLICAAEKISMIPDCLYFHRDRTGSISNSKKIKDKIDAFISASERCAFLRNRGIVKTKAERALVSCALTLMIWEKPSDDKEYLNARRVLDDVKETPKWLSKKRKFVLYLFKKTPRLFQTLCNVFIRWRAIETT